MDNLCGAERGLVTAAIIFAWLAFSLFYAGIRGFFSHIKKEKNGLWPKSTRGAICVVVSGPIFVGLVAGATSYAADRVGFDFAWTNAVGGLLVATGAVFELIARVYEEREKPGMEEAKKSTKEEVEESIGEIEKNAELVCKEESRQEKWHERGLGVLACGGVLLALSPILGLFD